MSDPNIYASGIDQFQNQRPDGWYDNLMRAYSKGSTLIDTAVEGVTDTVRSLFGSDSPLAGDRQPFLRADASWADIESYVAEWYGPGMVGYLNSIPEVRDVLIQAARNKQPYNVTLAQIQGTGWYRGTDAKQRDFGLLEANDPAEAQRRVKETGAAIHNTAQTLGLGFSAQQVASMAWQVERNGWSDPQTIDALLRGISWESLGPGELTANVDAVKDLAGDYLVQISDNTARAWSKRIASGEMTLAGVESALQHQAKSRFSWMGSQIDQGVTPLDYFRPVRDVVAGTLELPTEEINLMDPKWLSLVEVREPDGTVRGATMHEAMMRARSRPEFVDTRQADEMTSGLSSLVARAMGF